MDTVVVVVVVDTEREGNIVMTIGKNNSTLLQLS